VCEGVFVPKFIVPFHKPGADIFLTRSYGQIALIMGIPSQVLGRWVTHFRIVIAIADLPMFWREVAPQLLGAILEPPSGEAKQGGVQTISDGG